jgi:hypothetical protein
MVIVKIIRVDLFDRFLNRCPFLWRTQVFTIITQPLQTAAGLGKTSAIAGGCGKLHNTVQCRTQILKIQSTLASSDP